METLYEKEINTPDIEAETLESLKEASGITMQVMAESALKGSNMATKSSVKEAIKEETRDKNRGDVEHD